LLPGMFVIAQKLVGLGNLDPFNSPWLSAWRATSWFLKRIPETLRHGLAIEALRQTKALSIAAMLIHLNDPANRKEGETHTLEPALKLDTVEAMKAEWLRLIRSRAADGEALIDEPDLLSQLYEWRDYAGSLDEPREWTMSAIRTDEGFANMVTRMMSEGTSHSWGDRVSTVQRSFNKETVDDFIGIDAAKARYDAISPSEFPEHEEALRTLNRYLEIWLGQREGDGSGKP